MHRTHDCSSYFDTQKSSNNINTDREHFTALNTREYLRKHVWCGIVDNLVLVLLLK